MVSAAVSHSGALVKRLTLPSITMQHESTKLRNDENTEQRKYESKYTKLRKYETTKVRNNESTQQCEIGTNGCHTYPQICLLLSQIPNVNLEVLVEISINHH